MFNEGIVKFVVLLLSVVIGRPVQMKCCNEMLKVCIYRLEYGGNNLFNSSTLSKTIFAISVCWTCPVGIYKTKAFEGKDLLSVNVLKCPYSLNLTMEKNKKV